MSNIDMKVYVFLYENERTFSQSLLLLISDLLLFQCFLEIYAFINLSASIDLCMVPIFTE